ncbi:MAG TPA: energy transducer TonB [Terriglobia bacterium]|nr:energy transducer TonB [Terriglobia bacterium]
MFDHTLLDSAPARKALSLGYILEAVLVGALLLFPLIYTEGLPRTALATFIPMPPPPAASAPAPAARVRHERHITADEILNSRPVVPRTIQQIVETPEPPDVASAMNNLGVPGGVRDGVPDGILHSLWSAGNPPPPPPATAPPRRHTPLAVGGQVQAAKLVFGPKPEYPPLARSARIQGIVRMEAVISADGTIQHLTLISGHPFLVGAAMVAVARWRYQPTLLNGEPVEVVTDIVVNFTLGD